MAFARSTFLVENKEQTKWLGTSRSRRWVRGCALHVQDSDALVIVAGIRCGIPRLWRVIFLRLDAAA